MEKAMPTYVGCLLVGSSRATMKLHCIQCGSGSAAMYNCIANGQKATLPIVVGTTTANNNGERGFFHL
jgi:hypothetical protein